MNTRRVAIFLSIFFIVTLISLINVENHYPIPQTHLISNTFVRSASPYDIISLIGDDALDAFPDKTGGGVPGNPYVIQGLDISGSGVSNCIYIENTTRSLIIKDCTLFDGIYDGIRLVNCTDISVEDCTISNNLRGFFLQVCENLTIKGNYIFANSWGGIEMVRVNHSVICNNTISSNSDGITHSVCSFNTFINNTCNQNGNLGIRCHNHSNFNTYFNNTALSNGWAGIYVVDDSEYNNLSSNIAVGNQHGIFIDSSNNSICDNIAENNTWHGIEIYRSHNCTIERNRARFNSENGITLTGANSSIFIENEACFNGWDGIYVDESKGNTIMKNFIAGNQRHGVCIHTYSMQRCMCENNTFYLNTICGNGWSQAAYYCGEYWDYLGYSQPCNNWDNGTLGNYWGDYPCLYPRAQHNGITWNLPYNINMTGSDYDRFPLVQPIIGEDTFFSGCPSLEDYLTFIQLLISIGVVSLVIIRIVQLKQKKTPRRDIY